MDTRYIKDIRSANKGNSKVVNKEKIIWKVMPAIKWTSLGRTTLNEQFIKDNYCTTYMINNDKFIVYGSIVSVKLGKEYYDTPLNKIKVVGINFSNILIEEYYGEFIYENR